MMGVKDEMSEYDHEHKYENFDWTTFPLTKWAHHPINSLGWVIGLETLFGSWLEESTARSGCSNWIVYMCPRFAEPYKDSNRFCGHKKLSCFGNLVRLTTHFWALLHGKYPFGSRRPIPRGDQTKKPGNTCMTNNVLVVLAEALADSSVDSHLHLSP